MLSLSDSMNAFREKLAEIHDLNAASSVLQWDMETYMPPKGAQARGEQLSTLATIAHRMFTSGEFGDLLQSLHDRSDQLAADEAKLIDETFYDYRRAVKLPDDFVRELAILQSQAYEAWVPARQHSDFSRFRPFLERIVEMLRRKADLLGYEGSPYNALLEEYERDATVEGLRPLFAETAKRQSALVERIAASPHQPNLAWLEQEWDRSKQLDFTLCVLRDIGYDFEAGRQDLAVHPFSTNFDIQDVRVTTRVDPRDLFSALFGSLHEGGHALYEQGLPIEHRRSTLAESISLGIHESQSRLWENMVGRSLAFWRYYTPAFQQQFPSQLDGMEAETIYRAANRVRPSLIRVEADECTYNLHVILRFEIELALIEGEIAVSDVPEIWNAKLKQYLGLDVPNDAQGCLQDIHWAHCAMGYFPTYALGNLYAAQMMLRIETDIPDLWERVEQGDFAPLLGWLRECVHQVGRRKTASELIQSISGESLSAEAYLDYLEAKYGALYRLDGVA